MSPSTFALDLSEEVSDALANNQGVVALETTVVTHGLPWPHNLQVAQSMQAIVRAQGAVPAAIGVIHGRIKIGLTDSQLEHFANTKGSIVKASRRDLGLLIANRADGATTVAATMMCAHLAGVRVFATGGIGGVHRGAEHTFDVSADLHELGRTPVAVVCSGAKSILDVPKTLEVLESLGVPVVGFGVSNFPAFYVQDSGLPLGATVSTPEQAACQIQHVLGFAQNGMLIANPIPSAQGLARERVETWVAAALAEAREEEVEGKALTPFLLDRVANLSGGDSLRANIALLEDNAACAARIARALAHLQTQ